MARLNTRTTTPQPQTHGGVPAARINPLQQLRRSVMATLLWEDQFYEDGVEIATRIATLCAQVKPEELAEVAIEARLTHNLRHVSLLLLAQLAKHGRGKLVSDTMVKVLSRADELSEFLAIYWKDGRCPLSKQVNLGLKRAFEKFDAYQIAKYDRAADIRLRDVLFLVHAKPSDKQRRADAPVMRAAPVERGKYKRGEVDRHNDSVLAKLVNGTLESPDTWEVNLSGGKDKRETFERLIAEGKLGYFALLRNLRNMVQAGVPEATINAALIARKGGAEKVLPFRFIAAARACPQLEPAIDTTLQATIASLPPLPGKTVVMVDVSGSMNQALSGKSDLKRHDAAAALASIINGDLRVFTFSDSVVEVPPRKGMAGVDTILRSQPHMGTALAAAVRSVRDKVPHDRMIVITDEQATDARVVAPECDKAYVINVGSYQNGIGYGKWVHIDGFSENVIRFIHEYENAAR